MILKASQRGGGMALAAHLLKSENEHVEVHEISGFASDDLKGAMKEAEAVAKGTRCKQHLFSVSLNPPDKESVSVEAFESAICRMEEKLGLTGQPRVIVFHEKEGRRHAHAVWSRIAAETMTARQMSHFTTKLRDVSKALYLEHGWQMPRGLMDSREHDPRNFTLAEWQQAKRMGRDPRALKATVQECWAVSDSREAFESALQSRGLYLARGDRRGHVAVTYEGETVSIARITGKKSKEIAAKLGFPDALRSVDETKAHIGQTVAPRLGQLIEIADRARQREMTPLEARRIALRESHAHERERLDDGLKTRSIAETRERAGRLRGGVAGLWDRITGRYGRAVKENEAEAFAAFQRDRAQRNELVADQMKERRALQREIVVVRQRHASRVADLHHDISRQAAARDAGKQGLSKTFDQAASIAATGRSSSDAPRVWGARASDRGAGRDGSRSPDFGL